jgi:hypothetical protein
VQVISLSNEGGSSPQERLDDGFEREAFDEFSDSAGEASLPHLPDLQAESAQEAADATVEISQLGDKELARCEQGPQLLRQRRLHMHGSEPAGPDHLRNGASIVAVCLHRHCLGRSSKPPRLNEHDRQPRSCEASMEPLRQRTSLQANSSEGETCIQESHSERLRLRLGRQLADDAPSLVHDADAAGLK